MKAHCSPLRKPTGGYDLVGDIHGRARELARLLDALGYEDREGSYRHPVRKAVFLGDFVDRGQQVTETLRIVKAMVDSGAAQAVIGNHEYNLLRYLTADGNGGHLRPHTEKNTRQVRTTIEAMAGDPDEWRVYLPWILRLPIYLTLPGARVVHACWDAGAIRRLEGANTLRKLGGPAFADPEQERAVKLLLTGPELGLPGGVGFRDRQGAARSRMRVKWWPLAPRPTYRDLAIRPHPGLPAARVPPHALGALPHYGPWEPPLFVGHYGLETPPGLWAKNVACVDYMTPGGCAVGAYRWAAGERLQPGNFVRLREDPMAVTERRAGS